LDQNGMTGGISLSGFNFNGWTITITAGGSNSPNCSGSNGPGCLNQTNINATTSGNANLTAYFADTGFTATPGTLTVANASSQQTGSQETQQAYAFNGPLPSGFTTLPANPAGTFTPAGGTCGTLLVSNAPGVTATPTTCAAPTGPYDLELAETFIPGAGGGTVGFNVNGNITGPTGVVAVVPEPASLLLFGTTILGAGLMLRKKIAGRRS
jgi:hypothetical protein